VLAVVPHACCDVVQQLLHMLRRDLPRVRQCFHRKQSGNHQPYNCTCRTLTSSWTPHPSASRTSADGNRWNGWKERRGEGGGEMAMAASNTADMNMMLHSKSLVAYYAHETEVAVARA